jgi:hypothetical protein
MRGATTTTTRAKEKANETLLLGREDINLFDAKQEHTQDSRRSEKAL